MRISLYILLLLVLTTTIRAQTTIDTAVDFSAKDINGQTHHLYSILGNGNMVVIDFFSTSCGPCATYAPMIQESYQHFGMNSGNVYFMGISWGDDNLGVEIFDSIHGITYPSISGTQGSGNQINIAYNILSYPTLILILPDKTIREKHIWPPTTERIDSILIANGGITTSIIPEDGHARIHKLWPNPASDHYRLSLSLSEPAEIQTELVDITGRIVKGSTHDLTSGLQFLYSDISDLPGGLYILNIRSEGQVIGSRRLMKK